MIKLKELLVEAVDRKFAAAANKWVKAAQAIVDKGMERYPNNPRKILSIKPGKKYWKIIVDDEGSSQHTSVWAFLNTENGDVLKPASWNRPAKHARGNIYDSDGGLKTVGPYGPAYMR